MPQLEKAASSQHAVQSAWYLPGHHVAPLAFCLQIRGSGAVNNARSPDAYAGGRTQPRTPGAHQSMEICRSNSNMKPKQAPQRAPVVAADTRSSFLRRSASADKRGQVSSIWQGRSIYILEGYTQDNYNYGPGGCQEKTK